MFGFLGPNGAGKSTTIRMMLDLIRPTSGRIRLLGRDARRDGAWIRARLGYMPGDLRLYPRMTGRELVGYFAHLRRMPDTGDAQTLARRFDLDLDRPLRALSRGNRQKVGVVQAFMHRPEVLVLDEPTSGLDPIMQQAFAALTRETAERGGTVFLSSHVLSEVQHMADRVGVVREGRLELVDTVEALRAKAAQRVEVTFAAPPPEGAFAGRPGRPRAGAPRRGGPDGARGVRGRPRETPRQLRGARDRQPRGRPRGRLPRPLPLRGHPCGVAS